VEETALPTYFGEWLKRRRKELDLTQVELAKRAGCSVPALRKIEAGERRPSKQLAGLLARSLDIPSEDQTTFIRVARGELNVERLGSSARVLAVQATQAPPPSTPSINLPVLLTPFFGRSSELTALSQLLGDPRCRLLTLVGPGGIGKTRLAIEAASRYKDLFTDGIWFVPLAPLSSPDFLIPAIADALNFRFQDPARPGGQLLNFLHDKQILLVLDNVEHLLDGVGLFSEILESCPEVKLLVTSRERLNLLSEWVFEIQGLPVPASGQVEQFEEYSSVALFLQSARRIQAGFNLRDDERQWVVRICQIVEGMPLGIELAAAWVGLLSCEEIAREIESNLDFLRVSLRDVPERHRSLRATLDHSWNLLDPEEKAVLSRLSVFRGSFRREAVEEVCGASLTVLSSLKGKSLLHRTEQERYELHEIIQQYAALRLAEDASEEERLKDKHARYFAGRLSEWEKALKSSKQTETLSEMADEIDNLRQAWQRMVTCCQFDPRKNSLFSPSLFHSSLFSLSLFYEMRCRDWEAVSLFGEAEESLREAKTSFDRSGDQWPFEAVLGHIIAYLGLHRAYILQYRQAREYLEESLSFLERGQAKVVKAQAQIMLAWIYQIEGKIQKSIDLSEKTIAIFQEEGEVWWYALATARLAWSFLSIGKIKEGKALYQESLRLTDPGDLCLRVPILNGLAYASYLEKDYERAERLFKESQERSLQLGNRRQTALCFLDLGQVALATGRIGQAEKNFQESIDLLSEFGESHDLALGLIYLGKSLTTRLETEAARGKFTQVIQIGKGLNVFHLVYWGMVNLARAYMVEGQSEKALEMALVLQNYSVEFKTAGDDGNGLLAELKEGLSPLQMDATIDQTKDGSIESLLALLE
jgi:predicted ATPase/DNA-binding XRE family transcriptional regulator/TolA-binding protein